MFQHTPLTTRRGTLARAGNLLLSATAAWAGFAPRSPVAAQGTTDTTPAPAAPGSPAAGYRSAGINAVFTSVTPSPERIVIQLLIQNTRRTGIYITPIVARGNSGTNAFTSKGAIYIINNPDGDLMGMSPCSNARTNDYNQVILGCMKEFPVETMTYLDPDQTAVLGLAYTRNNQNFNRNTGNPMGEDVGDTISFSLKFVVRNAAATSDALTAPGNGAPGPASVVTINFPLVPLRSGP